MAPGAQVYVVTERAAGRSSPHSGTAVERAGSAVPHTPFGQSLQSLLSGSSDLEQELRSAKVDSAPQTVANVTKLPAPSGLPSKSAPPPLADPASLKSSAAAAMKASATNATGKNNPQPSPNIQPTQSSAHTLRASSPPDGHAIHRPQKKRQEEHTRQAGPTLAATPGAPQTDVAFDPGKALTCPLPPAPAAVEANSGAHRADLNASLATPDAHAAERGKTAIAVSYSPQGTSAEPASAVPIAIAGHGVASANAAQGNQSHAGVADLSIGSESSASNANSASEANSNLHSAQSQPDASVDPQLRIAAAQTASAGDRNSAETYALADDRMLRASAQRTAHKQNGTDTVLRDSVGQPAHATNPESIAPFPSVSAAELRATAPQSLTPHSADRSLPVEARPANAHEALAALDAQATPNASWVRADAHHAEAGYLDPALGWVGVRAETAGAALHATIVPPTADAAQMLAFHLPALSAYLTDHHATATQVSMAAPEMGTSGQGNHHEMSRDGTQQNAPQNARSEALDENNMALCGRITSNNATIPAGWTTGFRSGATISLLA